MRRWLNDVELLGEYARGATATVWRARHPQLAGDIALKVLTPARWHTGGAPREVAWEARLLARLRHPHIVQVLDFGEVPEQLSAAWRGQIPVGAPYLALPFAAQTLLGVPARATWSGVKEILVAVLQGLAHTHARGLIHCDLKPQNLLWLSGCIKISDFGISRWLRADAPASQEHSGLGTPAFMAPEQIRNELVGHYTDLYAVGCVAYWLLQGNPPFSEGGREAILRGHLADEPPRVRPVFACPSDLALWLRGLLAKQPVARFACAADALVALETLAHVPAAPHGATTHNSPDRARASFATETLEVSRSFVSADKEDTPAEFAPHIAPRDFPAQAWRDPQVPRSRERQVGPLSRALLALRTPAMVGRLDERKLLWQLLGEVHKEREPRIAIISGASGLGTSRLARWLLERAVELGLATGMVATHSPIARSGDGIAGALATLLGCHGRSRSECILEVRRSFVGARSDAGSDAGSDAVFLPGDVAALVDLARQDAATAATHPEALADGRWVDVVVRFLVAQSQQRPVVVWFDDIQWGLESMVLLERVLERAQAEPLALLAVVTLQDEAIGDRLEARELLARLRRRPEVFGAELRAMSEAEQSALFEDLLPGPQPPQLSALCRGNPLFAIEGAIASVEYNASATAEGGSSASAFVLPTTLHGLMQARIAHTLDRYFSGGTRGLAQQVMDALAAACSSVTLEELEAACQPSPAALVQAVLQTFLKAGFLTERRKQYSFHHGILRERLCYVAQAEGRFVALNLLWAQRLAELYGSRSLWVAERIANHLFLAGRCGEALSWIPQAAEHTTRLGFLGRTRAILRFRDDVLDAMGESSDSVQRAHGWLLRVRYFMPYEAAVTLDAWLAKAKTATDRHADEALYAHFFFARCHLYRGRENPSESIADGHRAAPHYRRIGDLPSVVSLERVFGEMERKLGHFDASLDHYETAASICEQLGDTFLLSWCRMGMAMTRKAQGKFEHVDSLLCGALEGFERAGASASIASSLNEKGELARLLGDLDNALHWYRKAAAAVPIAHLDATTIQWNMALVLLQQRAFDAAAVKIAQVRTDLVVRSREGRLIYPDLGELVCAAHARRWRNWDRRFAQIVSQLAQRVALPDFAVCAGLAAQECARAAEPLRAQKAYALAVAQWHSLGRDNEVALLRAKLEALQRTVRT